MIKAYFKGVGNINREREDSIKYCVSSIKDVAVIIEHFDKYRLTTQKRADYELFKEAFSLISRKEHLTPEGIRKLVAIKAPINRGLSDKLKAAFPNVVPVQRPLVEGQVPLRADPH